MELYSGTGLKDMLDTKKYFNKRDKRQGYHPIISFPEGEVDEEKGFLGSRSFCQEISER